MKPDQQSVSAKPTVTIRPAQPTDAEAAALTAVSHAAKRYWGYAEADREQWRDDLTITPADIRAHPTFVAVDCHQEIIGLYMLRQRGKAFDLEHLWVRPDYIGQRIGRQLFLHAREFITAQQAAYLYIEADPNAVGFYQRMGATLIGEQAQQSGRTLPLLRLTITH